MSIDRARAAAAAPGRRAGRAARAGPACRRARSRTAAAVLPHRLHGAVAPAVALPPELAEAWPAPRSRRGRRAVDHPPAGPAGHGQVGVLGERVVAEPARRRPGLRGGTRRSRRGRSACTRRTSNMPPVEVEADRRTRCAASGRAVRAGCRPWCCRTPRRPRRRRAAATRARMASGSNTVSPSTRTRMPCRAAPDAGVQRGRLAGVGLPDQPHIGQAQLADDVGGRVAWTRRRPR